MQKRHRSHRDTMRENVASRLHAHVKNAPQEAINFRKIFEYELFGISLKQVSVSSFRLKKLFFDFCSLYLTLQLQNQEHRIN